MGLSVASFAGCDGPPPLPPKGADTGADTTTDDAIVGQDLVTNDTDGPTPGCTVEPTLTSLKNSYFKTSCGFSGCHGARPSAGLELLATGLHGRLVDVAATDAKAGGRGKKLVVAGDAASSFLYQKVFNTHARDEGFLMPDGADTPVDAGCRIFMLRKWINDGALDN